MIAAAEHEFRLARTDKQGITTRAHLKAVERQTGRTPPGLIGEPIPRSMEYLWIVFLELNAARPVGMEPGPIGYELIAAYCALNSIVLEAWEVQVVRRLDGVWFAARDRRG